MLTFPFHKNISLEATKLFLIIENHPSRSLTGTLISKSSPEDDLVLNLGLGVSVCMVGVWREGDRRGGKYKHTLK